DFTPGEVNRLTDYVDADRFTNQSLIKRTPVHLCALRPLEAALWAAPEPMALERAIEALFDDYRRTFPADEAWLHTQREPDAGPRWLPLRVLQQPRDGLERAVSEAAGALTAFLQRTLADPDYRAAAGPVLRGLTVRTRDRLLRMFLPFIRRMDYQAAMHVVLAELVGAVRIVDDEGRERAVDLLSAHKSAILEFKEEIVAIQLYVAIKRALEQLFGPARPGEPDVVVRQSDLAFVSGVAIPCAGDVPAHFLGISPAELHAAKLVHSRAIGRSALIVVDRRTDRAVRIDIVTGVLPKDRELTALRGAVINKKRAATGQQHRRFFDRLGELIVDYVRTGDDNFTLFGPVPLPWDEYRDKLAFAPPTRRGFVDHLVHQGISAPLTEALALLGVIEHAEASEVRERVAAGGAASAPAEACDPDALYAGTLVERVRRVVETIIEPVLRNDGGRLDVLEIRDDGDVEVRFVGSCANCPYSLLSMEQIVKPTMLRIPGVRRVLHRARLRDGEQRAAGRPRSRPLPVLGVCSSE
ncbi:MAG: NifU family protein, partial [Myxococcales bacterium]|nr:NifU family protein [Myxococcales bacterium]